MSAGRQCTYAVRVWFTSWYRFSFSANCKFSCTYLILFRFEAKTKRTEIYIIYVRKVHHQCEMHSLFPSYFKVATKLFFLLCSLHSMYTWLAIYLCLARCPSDWHWRNIVCPLLASEIDRWRARRMQVIKKMKWNSTAAHALVAHWHRCFQFHMPLAWQWPVRCMRRARLFDISRYLESGYISIQ